MKVTKESTRRAPGRKIAREQREKEWEDQRKQFAEESKRKEFLIPGAIWNKFLRCFDDHEMEYFYHSEMPEAPKWFQQQLEAAQVFLSLSIRDRHTIHELIIDDEFQEGVGPYMGGSYNGIPVPLPTDPNTEQTLMKEARKLEIGYDTYLRAIFASRVEEIDRAAWERSEREKMRSLDEMPTQVTGWIDHKLRKKLESRYGKAMDAFAVISSGSGQAITHFDMLVKAAEEFLG